MDDVATIRLELGALERIQQDLAAISARADDQRRRDLITARRRLADQIARIGAVADRHFGGDAKAYRAYRALYSAMRSAAALHQANWPAVVLGERHDEYLVSARGVRRANQDFVHWMRDALA